MIHIKLRFRILLILLTSIAIFANWFFGNSSRVLNGVYLGGIEVSGMHSHELLPFLETRLGNFENSNISLFIEDGESRKQIEVTYEELGVKFDAARTADQVMEYGRNGNLLNRIWTFIRSLAVKTEIKPHFYVNAGQFASSLDSLLANNIREPENSSIFFESGFYIKGETPGKTYNLEQITDVVRARAENLSFEPVLVEFIEVKPAVTAPQSLKALEKVKTLDKQKITLVFDYDSWSLSGANLLNALAFEPKFPNTVDIFVGSSHVILKGLTYANTPQQELDVTLKEAFLDDFVNQIGESIDVNTVDATMTFDGQKIVGFTPARDGLILDRHLTKTLLLDKLSVDSVSGEKEIVINLPVTVTKAKINNNEINSLGIKELIGRGVSYFSGSIANRIYNLSLGAQRISGTLVKPGEVFSFNKSVGEVSGATGYKPAYVISSGRTVLDDGGGICQVSTTVFRAALNAGLPIIARTAHAYRVGYYEQGGFKPGLDATVWSPAVDFVFKNDTQHHVLVQAVVDPANAKLQVDIYGTNDGRRVELSTPVISNVTPAPDAKYQDDPSLPKGVVKQVDFAASGANSVFTRKVYKDEELIIDESFRSNYRPWQAIYLVGTGG